MEKIDFKKRLKHLYGPKAGQIVEVDVPAMNFLMIDGAGDPNDSPSYTAAIEALFAVSYTLKFMMKKGGMEIDYGVMPLEGLWWADDMSNFSIEDKSDWKWTAMMMQPEFITPEMAAAAIETVKAKKNPVALPLMRFETLAEGRAAQTLHIGPFTEEGPVIARLHGHIDAASARRGKHHEIYLSDIRRAAPEKWRTIIRQPME